MDFSYIKSNVLLVCALSIWKVATGVQIIKVGVAVHVKFM